MEKVLIFTGKFPSFGSDTDGGSILINSLISSLKDKCILDVLFTRTKIDAFNKIKGVRNVMFETYNVHTNNKFERRLINREQIYNRLKDLMPNYDKVVITHVSKSFGIEKLKKEEQNKIIIFPMFLTPSYIKSNEVVPTLYTELEKRSLNSCELIVTPSIEEKNDMVNLYGVNENKIKVIPRGYSQLILPKIRNKHNVIKMLNIGSIKKQKNNIESIELCGELIQKGYNVELHIAGGIQDKEEYNRCLDLINDLRMNDIVFFHGVLSQQDLSVLISNCDINLSTSLWETFGRGIFEGMAGGLPTVIYSRIACVQEYVKHGDGILFAENRADFLDILERIITDYEYYCDLSKKAALSASAFSSKNESLKLVNAILNKCVLIVFGTRPEFIKIYPLIVEFNRRGLKYHLLCTNQHQNIAKDIMELHNIKPEYLIDINRDDDIEKYKLKLVDAIARCIIDNSYDGVVVQGDTLSTLCGALAAYKTKTKLFHVEAGMRTYDLENPYPEEGYRIKISSMADYHFCPSYIEENNLINEGYSNIFVTGNTFVDYRKDNKKETTVSNCVLVTIHRRENLPCINKMVCEIKQLANYHTELEFFIPVHPNPLLVDAFSILSSIRNIIITNPLGPDEFYSKLLSSSIVISDSGGVQEECLIARKKLLVVRKSTERVIDYDYVKQIDPYKESMIDAFNMLLNKNCSSPACSLYGDGTASKNITEIIMEAI